MALLSAMLLSGCQSTSKPTIDFNSATDFSQFSSFSIKPAIQSTENNENPILTAKIEKVVKQQLALKSLNYQQDTGQLTVSISTKFSEESNDSSFSIGLGSSSYGRNLSTGVSVGTSIPLNGDLTFTHIVIDISDNNMPIWHGRDKYETSAEQSPAQEQQAIELTVGRLLEHFPPQAKGQ